MNRFRNKPLRYQYAAMVKAYRNRHSGLFTEAGHEKECVYEMTGQNATLVQSQFEPQSRVCYPAHTFVRK
ncbi:hypothetical protein ALQ79_200345 [Pseudomonas amygdali pv. lachrymans]|nr:hypothetical protein ALQ79_200345 [Pseudomonas amygdali pv. lachrymans]